MSEIKRALEPIEWKRYLAETPSDARLSDKSSNYISQDSWEALVIDDPHAVAALCLYGQPFGFTHEEAEVLHELASRVLPSAMGIIIAGLVDGIADKIDALLPPKQ